MKRYLGWIGALVVGAACVMSLGPVRASEATTWYVATTGSDSQPGTAAPGTHCSSRPARMRNRSITPSRAGCRGASP
jgi:hypothetical protein